MILVVHDWIIFVTNKRKCYSTEIFSLFGTKQGLKNFLDFEATVVACERDAVDGNGASCRITAGCSGDS